MSITLSMIVKNEQKVIMRCLESVVNYIDFFVIMDTGSSDDTPNIIANFFKDRGVKGVLIQGEFKNFSYARNKCLQLAYKISPSKYILLIDSDMILKVGDFSFHHITEDGYYITQQDNKLSYKNLRLIKNDKSWYYDGYTHEVLLSSKEHKKSTLPHDKIYIMDMSDGGSKSDKIERDIRLLHLEINEKPTHSRGYFYLANTYFGKGDHTSAEKYYRLRIEMGGWIEEVWYCYYRLGLIRLVRGNIPEAIYFLFTAIETHPLRLETYFHLLYIFRQQKMDIMFDIFREKAINARKCGKEEIQHFLFYEYQICEIEFPKLIYEKK